MCKKNDKYEVWGTHHVWPEGAVSTLLHCNGSVQCCHVMKQIQNSICYASCIHCVTQRICCRRSWNFENSTNVGRQDIWPCHAKKVETRTHLQKKSDTGATVNVYCSRGRGGTETGTFSVCGQPMGKLSMWMSIQIVLDFRMIVELQLATYMSRWQKKHFVQFLVT